MIVYLIPSILIISLILNLFGEIKNKKQKIIPKELKDFYLDIERISKKERRRLQKKIINTWNECQTIHNKDKRQEYERQIIKKFTYIKNEIEKRENIKRHCCKKYY